MSVFRLVVVAVGLKFILNLVLHNYSKVYEKEFVFFYCLFSCFISVFWMPCYIKYFRAAVFRIGRWWISFTYDL